MGRTIKAALAKAVIRILKPLVRVLIRNEVSHAEFVALAKRVYVDVAREHFAIPGRKMTHARVAVLTGLNRKEVVRLSKESEAGAAVEKAKPNRAMRVVNGWLNDPEFLDESGEPGPLPLQGERGSFAALVARYSGDITLGAVVDELERIGVVTRLDRQTVRLVNPGYIPERSELEKVEILSICAADLLGSAVHNLEHGGDDARFQRQVVYQQVPIEMARAFRQHSNEKSAALLRYYNRWLADGKGRGAGSEAVKRVGVGIYYFED